MPDKRDDPLTVSEREAYELRLAAFEAEGAEYRKRLAAYAERLDAAYHDELTSAWLRQAGRALVDTELQRAQRLGTPLSVAFVDIDGLKRINDQLGHAAGDLALRTVASALLDGLRGYDHVIRWGGDEFLCVLPGLTHVQATRRLEEARAFLANGTPQLGISVGVAERLTGESLDTIVARADRALYEARSRRAQV
jgi:diguanylate cyclase (GGDEF)-like protein